MTDATREGSASDPLPGPPPGRHRYTCASCGAGVEFTPGTADLVCPYCGSRTDIRVEPGEKRDYMAYAARAHPPLEELPAYSLTCPGCGSTYTTTALASRCPSCHRALVAEDDLGGRLKEPDGVVPFVVGKDKADQEFAQWARSRWFAPNALKKVAKTDKMSGCYVPYWGFDDSTTTDYTGQRGDHYWDTETYTTTDAKGNMTTQTRQVQRTRWSRASGRVSREFVDVLTPAVTTPDAHTLGKLGPWPAADATGYQPAFLAGFDCPRYTVMADAGFVDARQEMARQIEQDCRADIGGDEQRVSSMDTADANVLFRLVLMPLWVASYVLGGKTYDVYVNANTGEVVGERPYSVAKIAALVAAVLVVVAAVVAAVYLSRG